MWLDDMNDYCFSETNNKTVLTTVLSKLDTYAKKAKNSILISPYFCFSVLFFLFFFFLK
jgi:hypothetical protein